MTRPTRIKATDLVLFIICLMYLISYVDRVNISTSAPVIQKELGFTATELGVIFSAFAYPYALFQLVGGWLGDRLGPRRTLALCGLVMGAATILMGLASGVVTLVLARILLGIGEGSAFPTATRALASWMAPARRGFAQGIIHSFARFGNAATPPLIAFLVLTVSWRGSFIIVGLVGLVWVAVWWAYFRDDPRAHPQITEAEIEMLPPARLVAEAPSVPWRPLLRRMLPVTLTDFCYGWTLWLYLNWLPSFFLHQYHLNLKATALFASGVFLAGVVGDTVGGVVSDRILKRTGRTGLARISVIILGFLGSFACMMPILFTADLATVAIALSLAFFFAELIVAPIWAVPMDIAPRYAGTASGFMNFGFGLAGMISPVVFGLLIDATGRWDLPFIASLGLLLVGAGLALTIRPERRFADAASEPNAPTKSRIARAT